MNDLADAELDRATFRRWYAGLVAVAATVRLAYVLGPKWDDSAVGDELHYFATAAGIARGRWYDDPWFDGYSALHPPLTALLLAPVSWVDSHLIPIQRLAMAVYGTLAVALIGLLARRVLGRRVALAATAAAALYANLWVNDGLVMSETPAVVTTVLVLLCAYRYLEAPSVGWAVVLGGCVGLAGLARAELLLLGVLVALPATLGRRDRTTTTQRWLALGAAALAAVVVVSPWVIRNQVRFDEPVFMSTQDGLTLLGANCPNSYYGDGIGFWSIECSFRIEVPDGADESVKSGIYRDVAFDYIGDQTSRVPVVVAARVARGISAWDNGGMASLNRFEGRPAWASWIGVWQWWLLMPVVLYGLWRWPSRQPRWPVLATASLAFVAFVVLYGIPRFRVTAEIAWVLGLAVGAVALWDRRVAAVRGAHDPG